MTYFTADLHLGHKNIMQYCRRPFTTVEEMDFALIHELNVRVKRSDSLYIVGDFTMMGLEPTKAYRDRIHCQQIYLLRGNHDRLSAQQYAQCGFIFRGDLADIKLHEQHMTLCHYAMRRWNKSHHGAWHLFGHSHGQLVDDPKLFAFDIGVDCHKYSPVSFPEVEALMKNRTEAIAEQNHPEGKA